MIQFDHNSEIFTFEIPQYVDGHDMNKCDKVEIHYINIDGKTKEQSKDLFNAKAAAKTDSDLVFNLEGEKLLFCWKISGNATKYAGSLNFLVCFSCLDDAGAITYKWHTDIFKGIIISDGLSNTEAVAEQYSDVLEQWKKELENASGSGSGSDGSYVVNIIDNGDDTFRTDKTFSQISEAIAAGKEAVCVFGTYHYQLVSCTDTKIVFSVSECEGVISYKTFTIDNTNGDGEVIYKFDMPGYQYSTDGNLQTEDITVVGAINEVNAKVDGVINNGTVVSENADFAEVGEWSDGNPNNEDRIGYFVSVDTSEPGKTMVKATSSSDVRGVTMLRPAFAGNASADKYDADGNLLPQYTYVGFAGFVPVIDNGTCEVNGHCMPSDDGTAIPSTNNMGYQVIERIDDTHVMILVEPQADMMVRIKEDVSKLSEEKVGNPPTGAVGQILEIETVDESGKPKTYKAVNNPIGGGEVTDEQISNAVDNYMAANPIEESDPTVPEWAKQPEKPIYTAAEVGADATGTAESKVSAHNTATDSHNDIRLLIEGLTTRLNALADSDDTTLDQMSEVVAYIKSNKSLIDAITTSKINVSDIIDNLTTNVANKPLSAAQGVVLKDLINKILPAVTTADNGKFLRVSDGAWSAVALTDVSEVGA